MRKLTRRLGALMIGMGLLMMTAGPVLAGSPDTITVDGVQYAATKVSGPTVHFETPGANPGAAFTARNTWVGNGSENLPCAGGIHWIDNRNVLTISNCLPGTTTTTTLPPQTTTTTLPPTTTTTVPSTTTTTVPSGCGPDSPLWNEENQRCELPFTGVSGWDLAGIGFTGAILVIGGAAALALGRRGA